MADGKVGGVDVEDVLFRLTRYAQFLFGALDLLGAEVVYPGGDGPEDLAMNLLVKYLDPADTSVTWKDPNRRPTTQGVYLLLKKALQRDFFDLKKSKRYTTTVYVDSGAPENDGTLSLEDLAGCIEPMEGSLLEQERNQWILDELDDDPKAKQILCLQLVPGGYNAFTNQELAELLDTSVEDVQNRKKRVKNRLLRILKSQKKGSGAHG